MRVIVLIKMIYLKIKSNRYHTQRRFSGKMFSINQNTG